MNLVCVVRGKIDLFYAIVVNSRERQAHTKHGRHTRGLLQSFILSVFCS